MKPFAKKSLKFMSLILMLVLALNMLSSAQDQVLVCGDIIEDEIIPEQSETAEIYPGIRTFESYRFDVAAGTKINLKVQPLGDTFNVTFVILDAGGNGIVTVNDRARGRIETLTNFQLGASNQVRVFLESPQSMLGMIESTTLLKPVVVRQENISVLTKSALVARFEMAQLSSPAKVFPHPGALL